MTSNTSKPEMIGSLIKLPLTDGASIALNPRNVSSLTPHRDPKQADNTTAWTEAETSYTHFVDAPIGAVISWVRGESDHLVELPLTTGGVVAMDPEDMASLQEHRDDENVTVWKQNMDRHIYFIDATVETVEQWIRRKT